MQPRGTVLVPVVNPASATWLGDLAGRLAARDGALVVPLGVVAETADPEHVAAVTAVLRHAEEAAAVHGVRADGVVVRHRSVPSAVRDEATRLDPQLIVLGWQGAQGPTGAFGPLIDSIIVQARTPLVLARHQERPFGRVVLPVPDDAFLPATPAGLGLASDVADRLARSVPAPVIVLRAGETGSALPAGVLALSDRVHLDPRRLDRAVASVARPGDVVVVPVGPRAASLRAVTTSVAWALPDAWLLVVVDPGPSPEGDLAEAVRDAGTAVPVEGDPDEVAGRHVVVVTVGGRRGTDGVEPLAQALAAVGTVTDTSAWTDRRGRAWCQAAVQVDGPSPSVAVGLVMDVLARGHEFSHTEITYEVQRLRTPS